MSHENVEWYRPIRPELVERLGPLLASSADAHPHGDHWCDALIEDALHVGATDVHLTPQSHGFQIRLRVGGALIDVARVTEDQGKRMVRSFKTAANLDTEMSYCPQVSRQTAEVGGREIDIRLTAVPTICGEKLALRLLDPIRLERQIHGLGMNSSEFEKLETWVENASGLFVCCGPVGAGKTTTLYSLMQEMRSHEKNIATVEDPVEYQLDGITQIQVDERHELTFAEGIRTLLRLDVDLMMLGEIRDEASARAAQTAASTGRTMMCTLHARDAVGTVTSLRNLALSDVDIATSLQMVVAQRLVRTLCQKCRCTAAVSEAERRWLTSMGLPIPENTWHAVGCADCRQVGYSGMTGVFEVWQLTESDVQSILAHTNESQLRHELADRGHRPLLASGLSMVAAGTTTLSELRSLGTFYVPSQNSTSRVELTELLADGESEI